jgi:hypothetical protein
MGVNIATERNGLRLRPNGIGSWATDNMCLTAEDARQVVSHYRASYSSTRFAWLMDQAYRDTPFSDCAEVFNAARSYS